MNRYSAKALHPFCSAKNVVMFLLKMKLKISSTKKLFFFFFFEQPDPASYN